MPWAAATILILFNLIAAICPTAHADECFCLSHAKGVILRGCEAFKAPTDYYSTAVCTDPETGERSTQTIFSDWKRIEAGANQCNPCRPAPRDTVEVSRGDGAPAAAPPTLSPPPPPSSSSLALRILETAYARLFETGAEAPGYGLYSYLLIPAESNSSIALLRELFKAFPSIEKTSAAKQQINVLYLPFRKEKEADYQKMASITPEMFLSEFYDFTLARAILNHLCNPPSAIIQDICKGDLSRGPFIFTYATPASKYEPVPPPYLLVDLRDVHERAMREFVAAYQQQIKRTAFSDRERLDTLRLRILTITLTAADWTSPFPKALADIVRSVLLDSRR